MILEGIDLLSAWGATLLLAFLVGVVVGRLAYMDKREDRPEPPTFASEIGDPEARKLLKELDLTGFPTFPVNTGGGSRAPAPFSNVAETVHHKPFSQKGQ